MQFGNLSGLVNGTEQVVFDYEVTGSAVSTVATGNILNGNEDGWYTVIFRLIGVPGFSYPVIQINGDNSSVYGWRGINATSTAVADNNATGAGGIYMSNYNGTDGTAFEVVKMYVKSGAVRLANGIIVGRISGSTVTFLTASGAVYNNTVDNITSMTFYGDGATSLGVGTRIIVLKSNNFTNGTPTGVITTPYIKGAWLRVGSQVLTGTASSITFSGLDGDRDVLYMFSGMEKANTGNSAMEMKINNNQTGGYQYLTGQSTSVAGARGFGFGSLYTGVTNPGDYSLIEGILFAKSGYIRPMINVGENDISGTTIAGLSIFGQSWNNSVDNITAISFDRGGALFDIGTQIDLYALRPNG